MSRQMIIPLTFLVPPSTRHPMVIELVDQPLRMVVVDKESVGMLERDWDIPGLYFLFGEHPDGLPSYTAYVGKSPAGLRGRVVNHARNREEPWQRALLLTSAAGLDSSAIGWLEGRLHEILLHATLCDVTNRTRPGDDTLPEFRRYILEQYVAPVTAAMRALGYSPDTAAQHATGAAAAPEAAKQEERPHLEAATAAASGIVSSIPDMLRLGLIKPGATLHAMPTKWNATASVNEDGTISIGSKRFTAPSAAATEVTGSSWNGWQFWGLHDEQGRLVALDSLRAGKRSGNRRREGMFLRFWSLLLANPDARRQVGDRVSPRKDQWLGMSVAAGVEYNYFVGSHESRAELMIRKPRRDLYEALASRSSALSPDLVWDAGRSLQGQARVYLPVSGGIDDEHGWPDLQRRLIVAMNRLQEILDEPVRDSLAEAPGKERVDPTPSRLSSAELANVVEAVAHEIFDRDFRRAELIDASESRLRSTGSWSAADDEPSRSTTGVSRGRAAIDWAISSLKQQRRLVHLGRDRWTVPS